MLLFLLGSVLLHVTALLKYLMASESGPAWAVGLHFRIIWMSFPFVIWSYAEFDDIVVWSVLLDALQKAWQLRDGDAVAVSSWRRCGDLAEGLLHFAAAGALGGVFVASPAVSAELHIGFSPPCAVSLMLLVSQNNCIINNVRVNGSGGKTPSGSAGLRLQPDFRIYVFLIYVFDKCPRSYY